MTSTSRTRPGSRPPAEPPRISGLTFIRLLGSGGFADVFLYQQDSPSRLVAVKVLVAEMAGTEAAARLRREADAMAGLSQHPSIVTVFSSGVADDGRAYMVMEYYPKPALSESLTTTRRSVPNVLSIGIQLAGAVESAHRLGILHRDIKPGNILVDRAGRPVLGDFGISMTSAEAASGGASGLSVPYSPPEAFAAVSHPMPQSDVWSLAATLYALLAGRAPFEIPGGNNGVSAMTERIKHSPYIPIGRADVPPSLDQVLSTAMAKSPDARYWTMRSFGRALGSVEQEMMLSGTPMEIIDTEGEGAVKPPPPPPPPPPSAPYPPAPPQPSAQDIQREDALRKSQAKPALSAVIDQPATTLLGVPSYRGLPEQSAVSVPMSPVGIAAYPTGGVIIADSNGYVRMINPDGEMSILAGYGETEGDPSPGIATGSPLDPVGVAVDSNENIYVADDNGYIEMITPGGVMTIIAGNGDNDGSPVSGLAIDSPLDPVGVAVDDEGNLYVAENHGYVVKVTPPGALSIVAGNGDTIRAPMPGPATDSPMDPWDVAVDASGVLYIADVAHIVKVTPDGELSIVAGNGSVEGGPRPGLALQSPMAPRAIDVKPSGVIYIADGAGYIEKVSRTGILSIVAGKGDVKHPPVDGLAMDSPLNPWGVAVNSIGEAFIADDSGAVAVVSKSGILSVLT